LIYCHYITDSRKKQHDSVFSYDEETCILKGEIVNVSVDESALTDGKVDVGKVAPICFDPFNNAYHVIGEKVGDAWESVKKLM
jgi:conserved protein/domain typically associated with flavoprotein oxygenases, DIM6/NTAB family